MKLGMESKVEQCLLVVVVVVFEEGRERERGGRVM